MHNFQVKTIFKKCGGTSLVVQWLRICLPTQGTQVQSLVRELRSHVLWSNWAQAPHLLSVPHNEREARATQQKIPHATTKTWCSQINEKIIFLKEWKLFLNSRVPNLIWKLHPEIKLDFSTFLIQIYMSP